MCCQKNRCREKFNAGTIVNNNTIMTILAILLLLFVIYIAFVVFPIQPGTPIII